MEVSSQSLLHDRLNMQFAAADGQVFSQDHLDLHGTMEDYFLAKLELFTEHLQGPAIVHAAVIEDTSVSRVSRIDCAPYHILKTYGLDGTWECA